MKAIVINQLCWVSLALWVGYHSYSKEEKLRIKDIEIIQSKAVGKRIGRNAMLLYLDRTNQTDSVTVNIFELLTIEDSLDVNFKEIK